MLMKRFRRADAYLVADSTVELMPDVLTQVSGGTETRTCQGPTVCDTKGYCADSKGTCTPKQK